jgi:hypothetical protein
MKTKDLIYLSVAITLFIVVGVLMYTQLSPKKPQKQVMVEVVTPIPSEFNKAVISQLIDATVSRDFVPVIDLQNGLGNPKPFNPL